MNSLRAFLSSCAIVKTEGDLREGELNVLFQNGQPARLFDRYGELRPFIAVSIANPEALTKEEVAVLSIVTKQSEWIVILDQTNRVSGVIRPSRTKDLRIAARAVIKHGEFGTLTPLPSDFPEVSVSYYGCPDHPEAGRFALYQIGVPIPNCPICGKLMIKLQEKSNRAKLR